MRPAVLLSIVALVALVGAAQLPARAHEEASTAGPPQRYTWIEVSAGDRALLDTATGRLLRHRTNVVPPHIEETDLVTGRVRLRPIKTIREEFTVVRDVKTPGDAARTVYRAVLVGDASTFYRCLSKALTKKHEHDFNWWFAELQATWATAEFKTLFDGKHGWRFGAYEGEHLLDRVE